MAIETCQASLSSHSARRASVYRSLPSLKTQRGGFEESPEWRHHYRPNPRPSAMEASNSRTNESRLSPDPSEDYLESFSVNAHTTTMNVSSTPSVDKAGTCSKELPSLPRSNWKLMKAGRLKELVGPPNKEHLRLPQMLADRPGYIRRKPRLELTSLEQNKSKQVPRFKARMGAIRECDEPKKQMQDASGGSDAMNFGLPDSPHGLDNYHEKALSSSWDDLWRNLGGFDANTPYCDQFLQIGNRCDVTEPGGTAKRSSLPSAGGAFSKQREYDSWAPPVRRPPLPKATSLGIPIKAKLPGQSSGQGETLVDGFAPTQSEASSSSTAQSSEHSDATKDSLITHREYGSRHRLRSQQPRSKADRPKSPLNVVTSLASTAMKEIDADPRNVQTFSPSHPSHLTPSPELNRGPSPFPNLPNAPPKDSLPELPEQWDKIKAASRVLRDPSYIRGPLSPAVQPMSHDTQYASSSSASPDLMICSASPRKDPLPKVPIASTRGSGEMSDEGNQRATSPREAENGEFHLPKPANRRQCNASIAVSTGSLVDSTESLQVQTSNKMTSKHDMADKYEAGKFRSPIAATNVLRSRSEHTKDLKFRDLAKEKAARSQESKATTCFSKDTIPETSASATKGDVGSPLLSPSWVLPGAVKSPATLQTSSAGRSKTARHQKTTGRGNSRGSSQQHCHSSSNGPGREKISQKIGPSRIMVLAETDPDTQMFRASATTGSLTRMDMRRVEPGVLQRGMKVRREKSELCSRPRTQLVRGGNFIESRIKPRQEHTPPPSNPSSPVSSDGRRSVRQAGPNLGFHHVGVLVDKDEWASISPNEVSMARTNNASQIQLAEQNLLSRLGRESSELRLAIGLLSRRLENLTTFVETTAEHSGDSDPGLFGLEIHPADEAAARFAGSSQSRNGRDADESVSGSHVSKDITPGSAGYQEGPSHRTRTRNAIDSRPISLMSRYYGGNGGIAKDLVSRQPVRDDTIWNQLDVLNRASLVCGALDV